MLKKFNFTSFKQEYSQPSTWHEYIEEAERVREIIAEVQKSGDEALRSYTSSFDGVELSQLAVTKAEEDSAANQVDSDLRRIIQEALRNIQQFHSRQYHQSFWLTDKGALLGQIYRPLQRVGAYIPGGTAAYPSTVLMTVVPALIAGVEEIYLCTPPASDGTVNPVTLYTACLAGVKGVFKVGGAQAVAAMAYGTASVPRVEKIVGPGNIYVTLAKKEVFGDVGIDMLAGPSEIMVVADSNGDPSCIAADLLSQAEHDPSSQAYLVTVSSDLSEKVEKELQEQLPKLSRREVAERSLQEQGGIIVTADWEEAWEVVNLVAPEHLELHLDHPWGCLDKVQNAGSIFLGSHAPEAVGDYWAGTNHVLPTGRAARFASPLGVSDFMKYSQVISYSPEALQKAATSIDRLARLEGLDGHARSVRMRGDKG